jgi:hypothetical protein
LFLETNPQSPINNQQSSPHHTRGVFILFVFKKRMASFSPTSSGLLKPLCHLPLDLGV